MAITFLTNEDKNIIDGQINKNAEDISKLSEEMAELEKDVESLKNGESGSAIETVWLNANQIYNSQKGQFTANNARISNSPPVVVNPGDTLIVNIADGEKFNGMWLQKVGDTGVLNDDYTFVDNIFPNGWSTESGRFTTDETRYAVIMAAFSDDRVVSPGDLAIEVAIDRVEKEGIQQAEGYATSFCDEEDSLAQKVLRDRDVNTITFAVITDTHYGGNYADRKTLPQVKAINELSLRLGAKFVVHLGDAIHGGHSTLDENKRYLAEFWRAQNDTPMPVLYTLAHHEMYGKDGASAWGNDNTAISIPAALGMYGRTHRHLPAVYSSDKASWYVDIDDVRFIGLSTVTEMSPAAFSDVAISFLNTALNGDKPVIVFSHVPCRSTVSYSNSGASRGSEVETALNAYSGGVLAYMHGHTHWDNIVKPDDGTFPFWSTCCAMISKIDVDTYGCSEGNPVSHDRVAGEYSEYCFDIVNIHPDTGIIRSFRFGAGADREYIPE